MGGVSAQTNPSLQELLSDDWSDEKYDEMLLKYKNGEIPRYKGHLSDEGDSYLRELQQVPLFMNRQPEKDEIENSPAFQALQAAQYEDMEPEDIAVSLKLKGNVDYQKAFETLQISQKENDPVKKKERKTFATKKFQEAIANYTEGLLYKDKISLPLHQALFLNRAAVHYTLANYRSCLQDCNSAQLLGSHDLKMFKRAGNASFRLEKYQEALEWFSKGIQQHPQDSDFPKLWKTAMTEKIRSEKQQRVKLREEKKKNETFLQLLTEIHQRNITIRKDLWSESLLSPDSSTASFFTQFIQPQEGPYCVHLQGTSLVWPVCFMYPESKQTDIISHFHEEISFLDQLEIMFPSDSHHPVVSWDQNHQYKANQLNIYYETAHLDSSLSTAPKKTTLIKVLPTRSLSQILSHPQYSIIGGIPVFYLLVAHSEAETQFLQSHSS
eukprot:Sdes_comp20522_c0_seq1m15125